MKQSIIKSMSKDELMQLVKISINIGDMLAKLGYKNKGGSNWTNLSKRLKNECVDISHFHSINNTTGIIKWTLEHKTRSLESVLVEHSNYPRGNLKRRLMKSGLLKNECGICNLPPIWNNKKLVMVLDHINGINDDNRLDNLRLICPNCNSQMDTFAGKNCKKELKKCKICNKLLHRKNESGLCKICVIPLRKKKLIINPYGGMQTHAA